jgi:hypothetical protein
MRYSFLIMTTIIILLPQPIYVERVLSLILQQGEAGEATISSPVPGQAVQGAMVIRGTNSVAGFQSYEIDFSYSTDIAQTWFLIQESTLPVQDGVLAVWDTTIITDGVYNLRLVITRTGGEPVEMQVADLRVHNYTPIETDNYIGTKLNVTTAQEIQTVTPSPKATSTLADNSLPSTPTPLPTNPAQVTSSLVLQAFGKGIAFTIGIFSILSGYMGIRAAVNRRK